MFSWLPFIFIHHLDIKSKSLILTRLTFWPDLPSILEEPPLPVLWNQEPPSHHHLQLIGLWTPTAKSHSGVCTNVTGKSLSGVYVSPRLTPGRTDQDCVSSYSCKCRFLGSFTDTGEHILARSIRRTGWLIRTEWSIITSFSYTTYFIEDAFARSRT